MDDGKNLSRAVDALRFGPVEAALSFAGRAVQLAPEDARALTVLGYAQIANGQFAAALVPLQRAERLDPGTPLIAFALSVAFERLGQIDQSIEAARRAAVGAALSAGLATQDPLMAQLVGDLATFRAPPG